ncbi:MAG: hypothetical protein QXU32_06630 [Nitrososphaerales archaeon]
MVDRQRFINCILNSIRIYNRHYLYAVLEGRVHDEVIKEAFHRWQSEKGFGCRQAVDFIRGKRGDERKRGSKNPALARHIARMSEERRKELGLT